MKMCLRGFPALNCWHGVMFAIAIAFFTTPVLADDKTDVTSAVAAVVKDNQLTISASNATFGDTAPGVPKKLTVEYRIGDEKLKAEANENGKIEIAVPDGKKLVITKAVYGPAGEYRRRR